MDKTDMRIRAEISLTNIEKNLLGMRENLQKHLGSEAPRLMAVIKADGYGHGAVPIAGFLEDRDYIYGFAVATAGEALSLREAGIKKPVLILGYTFEQDYEELISNDIRLTVFKTDMAEAISRAAERIGKQAFIHIKLDTGMGRIGFVPGESALNDIKAITFLPGIAAEGLFTHLAGADMADSSSARLQLDRYRDFRDELKEAGVTFDICHYLNSAGIIRYPDRGGDVARAGITLYGLWPSEDVERDIVPLYPAMSIYSHIVFIKTCPAGTPISYGGTFVTKRESRVATIPVGYADGYPRSLSGCGEVIIRGRRAPVIGRVCMDQFMVDVTDIPEAAELDRVTLIGTDGSETVTFEEWQEKTGLLNYELSCHIGRRVDRIYDGQK